MLLVSAKSPPQSPHHVMTAHHLCWYSVTKTERRTVSDTQPIMPIQDEPATYEIRLRGHLPDRWAGWFGEVAIGLEADGTTRLICPVIDQAALHGLLKKIRNLGLPLLSINRVEPSQTGGGA
jgi:hypothetical protein